MEGAGCTSASSALCVALRHRQGGPAQQALTPHLRQRTFTQPGSIADMCCRDVLRLWQQHGTEIQQWKEHQAASPSQQDAGLQVGLAAGAVQHPPVKGCQTGSRQLLSTVCASSQPELAFTCVLLLAARPTCLGWPQGADRLAAMPWWAPNALGYFLPGLHAVCCPAADIGESGPSILCRQPSAAAAVSHCCHWQHGQDRDEAGSHQGHRQRLAAEPSCRCISGQQRGGSARGYAASHIAAGADL